MPCLSDRFLRLGLPLLAFGPILGPLTAAMGHGRGGQGILVDLRLALPQGIHQRAALVCPGPPNVKLAAPARDIAGESDVLISPRYPGFGGGNQADILKTFARRTILQSRSLKFLVSADITQFGSSASRRAFRRRVPLKVLPRHRRRQCAVRDRLVRCLRSPVAPR
jgi:hypothetical protein